MSVYRTGTVKRQRRTKTEVEQLDAQILEALREDHPQSVRHVFYRMTDPRLPAPVEKSDRGYRHVQDRVVKLRRLGRVPYDWVSDASRSGYFTPTYESPADFIRSVAGFYRADLWREADVYCEVWCESRSIAGVIQRECEALAVSLYPAGGFSSITLAFQAAQTINWQARRKRAVIFYIGDYDPAGVLIDQALERELREHLNIEMPLEFTRLGITRDQVQEFDLPTKPRKEKDRRARHLEYTVEAEAMPAAIMRRILRENVEALLPSGSLTAAQAAEESEKSMIYGLAEMLEAGNDA